MNTGTGFDLDTARRIIGWAVVVAGGLLVLWAMLRDRSRGRRRCPKCWYDMSGVPGLKCPECGREAGSERKLFATRRRWKWAAAAVAIVLAGLATARVPVWRNGGFIDDVPAPVLRMAAWTQRAEAKVLFENRPMVGWWGGPVAPAAAAPPTLSERWERVLVASECARRLDAHLDLRVAGKLPTDSIEYAWSILSATGRSGRIAMPELRRAARERATSVMACNMLKELADQGVDAAAAELERLALGEEYREVGRNCAALLADVLRTRPEALERVHRVLRKSDDEAVAQRIAAVAARDRPMTPSMVAVIDSMLKSKREHVRAAAMRSLVSAVEVEPWKPALLEIVLDDPAAGVRQGAAMQLRRTRPQNGDAVLRIAKACEDSDPAVRASAVGTLLHWAVRLGWDGEELSKILERLDGGEHARDEKREREAWMRDAIRDVRFVDASFDTVRNLHLTAPDWPELRTMHEGWARLHPEPAVRSLAMRGFISCGLGADASAELMKDVMAREENISVRSAAVAYLAECAPDDPRIIEMLAAAIRGSEPYVQFIAIVTCGKIGPRSDELESALEEVARQDHNVLARTAIEALADLRLRNRRVELDAEMK